MKKILLLLFIGMSYLTASSQSKLLNGAGKVGTTTTSQTKQKSQSTQTHKTNVVKRDPDEKYASSAYMDITGMSFLNTDANKTIIDDSGSTLYAGDIKYLTPVFYYRGLASTMKKAEIYVKIYDENGTLKQGSGSPEGYTYKNEVDVKSGNGQTGDLSGWGNSSGLSYSPGLYKVELWCKGNKIYEKTVRLYSGSTPVESSNFMKVKSVQFGSSDENNNANIALGNTLYEGDVKYLVAKVNYEGLFSNTQNVKLYYRIFMADGTMSVGSSSPRGFSSSETVKIEPGTNSLQLSGWGNDSGSLYKTGKHKYELWLDGKKIYETVFDVKTKGAVDANSETGQFFPVYGFELGKVTSKEFKDNGYTVEDYKGTSLCKVHGLTFWDHNHDGLYEMIYMTRYDAMPEKWLNNLGINWSLSYNQILDRFRKLGYTIVVNSAPEVKDYSKRKTLSAEITARSSDGKIEFELGFNYGNDKGEGYTVNSSNSLYNMHIRAK